MIEYFILLAVLLALSAFFSSSETAYLSIEGVRLEHERQRKLPGANRVAGLLAEPRRLLASILVGNNLVNTGAATVGAVIAQDLIGSSGGLSIVVATVAITVLLVIFGEIGPKSVALHHNLTLARLYSLPLTWWSRLIAPAVAALDWLSRIWLRVVGGAEEASSALSLGELRTAIVQSRDEGELAGEDTSVLLGALRLGETQIRRIMTGRPQIASIDSSATLEQAGRAFGAAGFLRLPVRSGTANEYIGYLHGSDVLAELGHGRSDRLVREVMREPVFESERASVQRVLTQMQNTGHHLMLLIDEFGGTTGLVTLEDILELVVGNIRSETRAGSEPIPVRIAGEQFVEGRRGLTDLGAELEIDFTEEKAETVAGMLLQRFRRIPQAEESIDLHGYRWTVSESDGRRIRLVRFRKLNPIQAGRESADAAPES
ncbi:MAG: hemolysin family protein [Chloroflexi bacterium]|nr:hemolysin family protein [Chloroflexota bacterium]MCY3696813.1 hemolysin family protein [Chloroflexota bacterium]